MNTTALKTDMSRMHNETEVAVRPAYLEALTLVERLHRRLLDVIKDEFDRRGRSDVNSVQALLLYNIGDKELTAGELRTKGYYLGSNVSYNVKKLVEIGFLHHARSRLDRRSVRISLTPKGKEVHTIVAALYDKHVSDGGADRRHLDQRVRRSSTSRSSASSASGPTRSAFACEDPCAAPGRLLRYSSPEQAAFFVSCESLPRERGRRAKIPALPNGDHRRTTRIGCRPAPESPCIVGSRPRRDFRRAVETPKLPGSGAAELPG